MLKQIVVALITLAVWMGLCLVLSFPLAVPLIPLIMPFTGIDPLDAMGIGIAIVAMAFCASAPFVVRTVVIKVTG